VGRKIGSLGIALGCFLRGSKTQCAACAIALKLFSKNAGGQKIKNTVRWLVWSVCCQSKSSK